MSGFLNAVLLLSSMVHANGPYERILIPLLTPPVQGAFGSEFHTRLRAHNSSDTAVEIDGLEPDCFPCPVSSVVIQPNEDLDSVRLTGAPGLFVDVPSEAADDLSFNLRVYDVSRAGLNFGTEIPVVRERELARDRITLVGVPKDPRFRKTLRIYGTSELLVTLTFSDGVQSIVRDISLVRPYPSAPAYATVSDFPSFAGGATEMIVHVDATTLLIDPQPEISFWAFISVTNNETQVITTITPQR